jgi:hypothetical protein
VDVQPRTARKAQLAPRHLKEAALLVKKYEVWAASFPSTLKQAKRGSLDIDDPQLVWQDELVEFWLPFTSIQQDLFALHDDLRDVNIVLADMIEPYIDPPATAQIEYATEAPVFLSRAGSNNRKQIAYKTSRLEAWHRNFTHWVRVAFRELEFARADLKI